jgi:threonyl-tRNA synthetase
MTTENYYTFENKIYRDTYRHTTSHIMAHAIHRCIRAPGLPSDLRSRTGSTMIWTRCHLYPDHLALIEAEMRKICKENLKLERLNSRALKRWTRCGTSRINGS